MGTPPEVVVMPVPGSEPVPRAAVPDGAGEQTRLSESPLWRLQRSFFAGAGLEAWRSGDVPDYVTTNAFIADAFASAVLAHLRDLDGAGAIDRAAPVHVIELGAGPGRFARNFLAAFERRLEASALAGLHVVYVMTDFAERTVAAWSEQPLLAGASGRVMLDFARFDVTDPGPMRLERSGATLGPGGVANPVVLIANYVFDAVPQDCFAVAGGRLHECLACVSLPTDAEPGSPELLSRVSLAFERRETTADYYAEPELNALLARYRERLPDTTFLFPVAALRCLRHFERLADGRVLLLAADKGYCYEEDLLGVSEPALVLHGGCFSFMANLHALAGYVTARGGSAHLPAHTTSALSACAFALGPAVGVRLARACEDELAGADALYTVLAGLRRSRAGADADELLATLRLARWDPRVFMECLPHLLQLASSAAQPERDAMRDAALRALQRFMPIGETEDVAGGAGILLFRLGFVAEARDLLERSWQARPEAATVHNLAACAYELGDDERAREYVDLALEMDAACQPARALRLRLESRRWADEP